MRIQWNQFTGCWSAVRHVLFIIVEGTRYRHTVTGTVWFCCPKKFKSKFIHYIIIKNYYYSLVDACCYYEMRVIALRNSLQTYILSLEQFDSTAPKNLTQNLFIILLLKITITHWLMHAVTMKWESLRNSLQTYIQSIEQFDSAAPKNLNQNLFIILLLKITIIHWLMHAVAMKWESLHRKNYFWRFNFLVGAKSTFYSSNECYVHCWNIIYTVFQWNVLALKWIECFSVRDSWDHKRSGAVYTLVYRSGPQPSIRNELQAQTW